MRWREGRRSQNVEDLRGRGGGMGGGGGFKLGIGALVLMAAAYFLGVDPRLVMGALEATQGSSALQSAPVETSQPADDAGDFLTVVLADTEDVWTSIFQAAGERYQPPLLRLYDRDHQIACGLATPSAGPFYCPADQRIYIDPRFFSELAQRFGAAGDFAQAYVLAHEVGHHVQLLIGVNEQVRSAQARASQAQQNALQVRMELQADCFAGIWAHHAERARSVLESGDLEEALGAASAVGDDMIQQRTQGRVVPESFTHGSAAQRQRWFRRGFEAGDAGACDTFAAGNL